MIYIYCAKSLQLKRSRRYPLVHNMQKGVQMRKNVSKLEREKGEQSKTSNALTNERAEMV